MNRNKLILIIVLSVFTVISCDQNDSGNKTENEIQTDILNDISPILNDQSLNSIIEIPSGTIDKWELNKQTKQIEWEEKNGKPRVVKYIGYPGNYGFIPQTLLPKDKGGDGDPLDIIVLGPPAERGSALPCKLIGILHLIDKGEQDDKLIAIAHNSPLYHVNDISQLRDEYDGVLEIIELWFSNYKGFGKMESKGFGNQQEAHKTLKQALLAYKIENPSK